MDNKCESLHCSSAAELTEKQQVLPNKQHTVGLIFTPQLPSGYPFFSPLVLSDRPKFLCSLSPSKDFENSHLCIINHKYYFTALINAKCQQITSPLVKICDFISEESRVPCVKAGLITTILSLLESEDSNVVLQALRAIGNISYENGKCTFCG